MNKPSLFFRFCGWHLLKFKMGSAKMCISIRVRPLKTQEGVCCCVRHKLWIKGCLDERLSRAYRITGTWSTRSIFEICQQHDSLSWLTRQESGSEHEDSLTMRLIQILRPCLCEVLNNSDTTCKSGELMWNLMRKNPTVVSLSSIDCRRKLWKYSGPNLGYFSSSKILKLWNWHLRFTFAIQLHWAENRE